MAINDIDYTKIKEAIISIKSYVNDGLDKKADSSHGTHVTFTTSKPKAAAGTEGATGSSTAVARADHVHPAQEINGGTAKEFSDAVSVNLTGDVTGSASSKAGWSIATTLSNSGVTGGNYGPSNGLTLSNGGSFTVPYITVDAKGRVTGASTKTMKLPTITAPDGAALTDTKVTNTLAATTKAYVTGTTSATTSTGGQVFDTGVYLSTTAGEIVASTFKGNATSATKATQDGAGQQITTTYIKGLSISGKTITYTKGDGTTGTLTTQDTTSSYSTGTATTAGLTKLYTGTGTATDGTMTQAALKTALDGKAATHSHPYLSTSGGSLSGNLSVTGNITASGNITGAKVYGAVYNDYAEWFEREDMSEVIEPGDILIYNTTGVTKSNTIEDNRVVGVYSDSYGHILGGKHLSRMDDNIKEYVPIGLAGRVDVKIIGEIKVGDLIVASDIPGVGMRAINKTPGTIIGKALENYDGLNGIKKIKMLILNI